MSESRVKRYSRYIKYMFQWLFLEKVRGVDFSMRDTSLLAQTEGAFHGYSKTDEKHAKAIFASLRVDSSMNLLDVGCGKGAFLREAARESFGRIAGIEYVDKLARIARCNFEKLGLSDKIKVYHGDASLFKRYGEYNVFYFFNPFEEEIMDKVVKRISDENPGWSIIILHNPTCSDIIKKYGWNEVRKLYDPVKSYETIIYEKGCRN